MYGNFLTEVSENLRLFPSVEMFGIENEEICICYLADFQQQIRIYETLAKDVVHVLPRIVQLASQPSDCVALPFEFFFDKVSDMWFLSHRAFRWLSQALESK